MGLLYHYTKIDAFKGIVCDKGLKFWSKHFTFFNNGEYKWIKADADKIIEDICHIRGCKYDKQEDVNRPCIICFCKNGNSKRMWSTYAQGDYGIQFILDSDLIRHHAYENFDHVLKCVYMKNGSKPYQYRAIKQIITSLLEFQKNINEELQPDLEAMSVSLKQYKYRFEREIRYVHNYPIVMKFNGDTGEIDEFPIPPSTVQEATKDEVIVFPKKCLLGIRLGLKVNEDTCTEIKDQLKKYGYDHVKVEYRK